MKRTDIIVIICTIALLAPFFIFPGVYSFYKTFNAEHGMIMSFMKFAILSTFGECIGLRITHGRYNMPGFGIMPRALVWGILGMGISMVSEALSQFPEWVTMVFASSPVVVSALVAIILNIILPKEESDSIKS